MPYAPIPVTLEAGEIHTWELSDEGEPESYENTSGEDVTIYVCTCGASANGPKCDGSHIRLNELDAEEARQAVTKGFE